MEQLTGPKTYTADAPADRVDRFLAERLAQDLVSLSRARVKALIEAGHLTRGPEGATQVVREPATRVLPGTRFTLHIPPLAPAVPQGQNIDLAVLYEDSDLIVLDKPAGLVVHPAPGNPDGTLVNALIAHCGDSLQGIGGEKRPGIVHRLDKETSGVMVAAKSQAAHVRLTEMFAARDLDRAYTALAWGLAPAEGRIEGAIGRDPKDRKRMAVTKGGRSAVTHYRRIDAFGTAACLLDCRLETGRTHQIRVHLAHIGHPLVGDPVYLRRLPAAARGLPEAERRLLAGFPRQALHARSLGFRHPCTGAALRFETPLPADFLALLAGLRARQG
jgi:23S rRNA pseudouridine1911/1915/1917 synthase